MTTTNHIKGQLIDFVDSYRKYFWRTLGSVLTFTVLCLVAIAFLLKFSKFDPISGKKQISLLSYFFSKYSVKDIYSLVDLGKTVFIFFVSFFSLGLIRLITKETNVTTEFSFSSFIKQIRGRDVLILFGTLILSSAIDFGLFWLNSRCETFVKNYELQRWLLSLVYLLRIYFPLILFSISIYKLTYSRPLKLNIKKIILLFISLWLFNEFAYEVSLFVRGNIFSLILAPFDESKKFLYESFLGISLVAFYFVGYFSAMTTSLNQLINNE